MVQVLDSHEKHNTKKPENVSNPNVTQLSMVTSTRSFHYSATNFQLKFHCGNIPGMTSSTLLPLFNSLN